MADRVAASDVHAGFTGRSASQGLGALMWGQRMFASELHASCLGPGATFTRASQDQGSLELRKSAQHREHQLGPL
jgi:hypothetical protein